MRDYGFTRPLDAGDPWAALAPVVAPAHFIGYRHRRPWLWTVDVNTRAIAPTFGLPGNTNVIDAILVREGWLAVSTRFTTWSMPRGLNAPGRRLRPTSFIAHRVPNQVWVTDSGARPGVYEAIDGDGRRLDELSVGPSRLLRADTPGGLLIEDVDGTKVMRSAGHEHQLAVTGELLAWSGLESVWARGAALDLVHLATGATTLVAVAGIESWHGNASYSPDGRYLALSGYRRNVPDRFALTMRAPRRPSSMVVIDLTNGVARRTDDVFDDFAWSPAWLADSSAFVFGAPFSGRRLFRLDVATMEIEAVPFPGLPVMPMVDLTRV